MLDPAGIPPGSSLAQVIFEFPQNGAGAREIADPIAYKTSRDAAKFKIVYSRVNEAAALLDGTERGREFLLRTPMHRFGQLDELGGAAIFLASDAASFVTGQVLVVDGGMLASGVNQ